jgi:aminoglycoside phosphotransferase (APT) family kinase protein
MQVLGTKTDIPVPEVLWLERDDTVLGAPFLVMEKLAGLVPQDDPPFTATGWLLELSDEDQHTLYDNGLRALSALATLDVEALGFGFLSDTEMGAASVAANVDKWRGFFDWSRDGEPNPVIEAGFEWLDAYGAPEPERLAVSWGDARLGNIMYHHDLSVAGLLDWELASLSSPEADLGWWLFLLRHHTEGIGLPMPAGFPAAAATVARWEELTGLTARNLDYFEVYAAVRLAVAMVRAAKMMIANGQLPPDAPMAFTNPAVQLLGSILGMSAPALETQTFIGNR